MSPPAAPEPDVARARALLRESSRVVVLTGAGVSAESGVPTFRGDGGLWKEHRPQELATPQAFAHDPRLVWEWYGWRRDLVAACAPNAAHEALARLALARPGRTTLVTQNVDGLHHRAARSVATEAGADPALAYPLEVHGALHRDRCTRCGATEEAPSPVDSTAVHTLPRCVDCGALMRPDVVWFGEALDPDVIGAACGAAEAADLCLVVGTSAVVYPAASIPEITRARGGRVIEVNIETTPLTPRTAVSLTRSACEVLPMLLDG